MKRSIANLFIAFGLLLCLAPLLGIGLTAISMIVTFQELQTQMGWPRPLPPTQPVYQ